MDYIYIKKIAVDGATGMAKLLRYSDYIEQSVNSTAILNEGLLKLRNSKMI